MLIIAHRAQEKYVPARFGVEIDVRDAYGGIYLTHDPVYIFPDYSQPHNTPPRLSWWLEGDIKLNGPRPIYAVNIKADGFEKALAEEFLLRPALLEHSFFFDGSYPTMRRLKTLNVPVAERISEEEPYRGHSDIIWLDRWDWLDGEGAVSQGYPVASGQDKCCRVPLMNHKTGNRTTVYAVSPELHIPNCQPSFQRYWWRRFEEMGCAGICTDHWLECEEFLHG